MKGLTLINIWYIYPINTHRVISSDSHCEFLYCKTFAINLWHLRNASFMPKPLKADLFVLLNVSPKKMETLSLAGRANRTMGKYLSEAQHFFNCKYCFWNHIIQEQKWHVFYKFLVFEYNFSCQITMCSSRLSHLRFQSFGVFDSFSGLF